MDQARYVVALILLISLPPGLLLWFFIHPFASFWRKLGPVWTYTVLAVPTLVLMIGVYLGRRWLVGRDLGTSYPLIILSAAVWVIVVVIALKRKKQLSFGILSGLPELSEKQYPGKLLKEGIYAKIRHPRYVEVLLAVLAYALFANYSTPHIAFLGCVPVIYLIVLLEERELRRRFGSEYEAYARRVPRFVPRLWNSQPAGGNVR
jgi:protein-S-isoprenylcysteine O-methyltransferase Ste14